MVFNAPVIIFQLYRGGKFYWKTSENPKKTTNLSQLSHWQALPRNAVHLILIDTDSIGSCNSNYHAIKKYTSILSYDICRITVSILEKN
jgi:ssRNA-specific RNase YbeY (16S rRNA maturation enzyme)